MHYQNIENLSVSDNAINFLKSFEKFRPNIYDANKPNGDWTIGYGHKIYPGESFSTLTKAQGIELFKNDLRSRATDHIKRFVNVPMTQTQYDALASYVFNNGGSGALSNKKLTRYLNHGEYGKAAFQMDVITAGHEVQGGLIQRRMDEKIIWFWGLYFNHK